MGEIKGFPTIMFFGSESSPNPHKKGMPWKNPEPYQGQRTAAAIANYATSRLPNFVVNKNIDAFLKDGAELNKVVLFTDKKKTTNLYKALAVEFKDRLAFSEVHKSNAALVEEFGVTTFPTFVVVEGETRHPFEGKPSRDALVSFFEKFAKPAKNANKSKSKSSGSEKGAAPEPVGPLQLIQVTDAASYEKECLKQGVPLSLLSLTRPPRKLKSTRILCCKWERNTRTSSDSCGWTDLPTLILCNNFARMPISLKWWC